MNDFHRPCSVIERLTSLDFNPKSLRMRHDSKTLRYELIPRLKAAGLLPTKDVLEGRLPRDIIDELGPDLPDTEDGPSGILDSQESVFELMGVYVPRKEVVVYDLMCDIVSARLSLDARVVKKVVAAHEVVHAITHLGRDHRNRIWKTFGYRDWHVDRELFAQIYALFYFRAIKDNNAIKIFRELSNHQDEIYNVWRLYEDYETDDVSTLLLARRLQRIPPINLTSILDEEQKSIEANRIDFREQEYEILRGWLSELHESLLSHLEAKEAPQDFLDESLKKIEVIRAMAKEHFGPSAARFDRQKFEAIQDESEFATDSWCRVRECCQVIKHG